MSGNETQYVCKDSYKRVYAVSVGWVVSGSRCKSDSDESFERRVDPAAVDAKDAEELAPERLGLPTLTGLALPLVGKADCRGCPIWRGSWVAVPCGWAMRPPPVRQCRWGV